nr:unnamed protein product [Callosobruchus chinensis]
MLEEIALKNNHFNYESLFAVGLSAVFWRSSYILTKYLLPSKCDEYCCRIISLLHGFVVAFIGINQCFMIDSPFEHPEWRTSYMQSFLMVASLGYFMHDLVWCFEFQTSDKLMIAHHAYSIIALFRMLFKGYSGAQATCALGSMEITNPLLQARWFIRSEGLYPSVLFTSVETTFIITFVLVRIVLGTYYIIASVGTRKLITINWRSKMRVNFSEAQRSAVFSGVSLSLFKRLSDFLYYGLIAASKLNDIPNLLAIERIRNIAKSKFNLEEQEAINEIADYHSRNDKLLAITLHGKVFLHGKHYLNSVTDIADARIFSRTPLCAQCTLTFMIADHGCPNEIQQ